MTYESIPDDYKTLKNLLKENKKTLEMSFFGNKIGFWDWEVKENRLYYSKKWNEAPGYKEGESREKFEEWDKKIHPDDRKNFFKNLDDYLSNKTDFFEYEYRVRTEKDTYRWIKASGTVFSRDTNNSPLRLTGIYVDTTEEKASHHIKEGIFKYSLDMLSIISFDGYFLELNPPWPQITGWSHHELKSKSIYEFIHSDDREKTKKILNKLIKGENIHKFDSRFIFKDKNFRWIAWNFYPDPENKRSFAVARDVSERRINEELLKNSEKINITLLNASSKIAILIEPDGTINGANQIAAQAFQTTSEFITGKNIYSFLYRKLRPTAFELIESVVKTRKPKHLENEQNGVIYEYSLYPITASSGNVEKIAIYANDISTRKETREIFQHNKKPFPDFFTVMPIPAYAWKRQDNDFIFKEFNKAAGIYTSSNIDKFLNIRASEFFKDQPELINDLNKCFETHFNIKKELFYKMKSVNGAAYFDVSYVYIEPDYVVILAEDITDTKKMEKRLKEMATTDELTSLPNRKNFRGRALEEIFRSVRYKHPMSLMVIDIDHFRAINDTFGHSAGDEVLKYLSRIIQATIREMDIPGRLGGEEFAVILPETDLKGAYNAAERLRKKIMTTTYSGKDNVVKFTVSIGISSLDKAYSSNFSKDMAFHMKKEEFGTKTNEMLETLLKKADIGLYESKRKGRNQTNSSNI